MPTGCLRGGLRWVFPPVFSPGSSRLKLPTMVGLALGRETLGTSLLEECLRLSQQPEEDPESYPESKGGCVFLP